MELLCCRSAEPTALLLRCRSANEPCLPTQLFFCDRCLRRLFIGGHYPKSLPHKVLLAIRLRRLRNGSISTAYNFHWPGLHNSSKSGRLLRTRNKGSSFTPANRPNMHASAVRMPHGIDIYRPVLDCHIVRPVEKEYDVLRARRAIRCDNLVSHLRVGYSLYEGKDVRGQHFHTP